MIHHVSVGSNDIARARSFYDPLMALLGMPLLAAGDTALDYGSGDIQFSVETPVDGHPASVGNGVHVAFQARDRAAVREFHRLGLANGGSDAGEPGVRPDYDANYFGAFLRDPDGNKVEALTFAAE
ncbi:VOC family protein [Sphingoaurantiacus capsulatus]|uniref:VOC family protein n=1 Tax=Sphingoaurantiacus capsulatus TaxID=1771310 RepID=A0ABV7XAE6_9SPHN